MKWWDWIPWFSFFEYWVLNQLFSLSSITFIKSLFSFPLLSAIRVVTSAYLRLLIFLPTILIPAYVSSSPAFCMMYSAYGLPLWLSCWRIFLQCGRPEFDLWVGKMPWRREKLPTPGFWPGEFRGLYSPWGCKEQNTTEKLSLHSAYKLNKQGDNIQPCCTPFPILNQLIVPCPVLTVASWPAYNVLGGRPGGLVFPSL